jgi:hypothetical protein
MKYQDHPHEKAWGTVCSLLVVSMLTQVTIQQIADHIGDHFHSEKIILFGRVSRVGNAHH